MSGATHAPLEVGNRLRAVLLHVPFYSIQGAARLAADASLSPSTICRLCGQKSSPSYAVAEAVTWAISKRVGIDLESREIFSTRGGTYPTPSACELMGCPGCLPPEAWDEDTDMLRPEWQNQKPGEWSRLQASPIAPVPTV